MCIKIIVFSLITVVIAGNVQYTEEDARKDILAIINYAFGHKTIGHMSERNGPLQLNERNGVIQAIKHGYNNRRTDTHLAIEQPMELNLNQRLNEPFKTSPRFYQSNGRKTFQHVNQRRPIFSTESTRHEDGVTTNQEQFNSCDFEQTNKGSTKSYNVNTKLNSKEDNTPEIASNKINTTPTSEVYDIAIKNVATSKKNGSKTNKISILNMQSNNSTQNMLSSNVSARENQTENTSPKVSGKEVTIKPQIKNITTKVVDEDRWIWDDGTTTTTPAPDLGDRAAFAADKCPSGQVKFENMCVDES